MVEQTDVNQTQGYDRNHTSKSPRHLAGRLCLGEWIALCVGLLEVLDCFDLLPALEVAVLLVIHGGHGGVCGSLAHSHTQRIRHFFLDNR